MNIYYKNLSTSGYIYGKIDNFKNEIFIEEINSTLDYNKNLLGKIINEYEHYEKNKFNLVIIKDSKLKNQINKIIYKEKLLELVYFIKYKGKNKNTNEINKKHLNILKLIVINFIRVILLLLFSYFLLILNKNLDIIFSKTEDFLVNFPLGIKLNRYISKILNFIFMNNLKLLFYIFFNKIAIVIIILLNICNIIKIINININNIILYVIFEFIFKETLICLLIILNRIISYINLLKGLINNSNYDISLKKYVFYNVNNKFKPIICLSLILLITICFNFVWYFIFIFLLFLWNKLIQIILNIDILLLKINFKNLKDEVNESVEKKPIFIYHYENVKIQNNQFYFKENVKYKKNLIILVLKEILNYLRIEFKISINSLFEYSNN